MDEVQRKQLEHRVWKDLLGSQDKDGTYWHMLTRVKEARQYGTLTIEDFKEFDDEEIIIISDFVEAETKRAVKEVLERIEQANSGAENATDFVTVELRELKKEYGIQEGGSSND